VEVLEQILEGHQQEVEQKGEMSVYRTRDDFVLRFDLEGTTNQLTDSDYEYSGKKVDAEVSTTNHYKSTENQRE
jgi:hypothetical protein